MSVRNPNPSVGSRATCFIILSLLSYMQWHTQLVNQTWQHVLTFWPGPGPGQTRVSTIHGHDLGGLQATAYISLNKRMLWRSGAGSQCLISFPAMTCLVLILRWLCFPCINVCLQAYAVNCFLFSRVLHTASFLALSPSLHKSEESVP